MLEKRLIDVDVAEKSIRNAAASTRASIGCGYDEGWADALSSVADMLKTMPTVDAVEVVQCGKCLYYSETTGKDSGKPCGYGSCTKPFHITNIVTNEDFCSFGQRRKCKDGG